MAWKPADSKAEPSGEVREAAALIRSTVSAGSVSARDPSASAATAATTSWPTSPCTPTYAATHRPVPGFLALDQPTQAFFPSKPRDASTVPDADWSTVTEYFRLLHDVTELNEGNLQIIVCDHANLPDGWFQEAVIGNWRPRRRGHTQRAQITTVVYEPAR